jgi:hypothetical protein
MKFSFVTILFKLCAPFAQAPWSVKVVFFRNDGVAGDIPFCLGEEGENLLFAESDTNDDVGFPFNCIDALFDERDSDDDVGFPFNSDDTLGSSHSCRCQELADDNSWKIQVIECLSETYQFISGLIIDTPPHEAVDIDTLRSTLCHNRGDFYRA